MEIPNKDDVQNQIDDGRKNQVVEGMPAVADGLENPHEHVVHDKADGTGKVNLKICHGLFHDIWRRAHPDENLGREHCAHHGQENAGSQSESHSRVDGKPHAFRIPGAELARNDDAGAGGEAAEQADQHENQAAGGADCRQGAAPEEVADNQGVDGVVHLLEQIPEKKREGKVSDPFPDRALRHRDETFCHMYPPYDISV